MYYNNYIYNLVKYLNRFGKEVIIFQCLRSPDALNQGISFFLIVEERGIIKNRRTQMIRLNYKSKKKKY